MLVPAASLGNYSIVSVGEKSRRRYPARNRGSSLPCRPRMCCRLLLLLLLCFTCGWLLLGTQEELAPSYPLSEANFLQPQTRANDKDAQRAGDTQVLLSYLLRWAYGADEEQSAAFSMYPHSDYTEECRWFSSLYRLVFNATYLNARCGKTHDPKLAFSRNNGAARPLPIGHTNESLEKYKKVLLDPVKQLSSAELLALDRQRYPADSVSSIDTFRLCTCLNGSLFYDYWNISVSRQQLANVNDWLFTQQNGSANETLIYQPSYARWANGANPQAKYSVPTATDLQYITARDNASLVADLIDYEASRLMNLFHRRFYILEPAILAESESVSRFSCFMAALGNNEFSSLIGDQSLTDEFKQRYPNASVKRVYTKHPDWQLDSLLRYLTAEPKIAVNYSQRIGIHTPTTTLLASINPDTFFPNLGFTTDSISSSFGASVPGEGDKPYYELAYLVMLHDHLENAELLLKAIYDESVFILIHVDASAKAFKIALQKKLGEWFPEGKQANARNVMIMPVSYDVLWGHVSIVWAETLAFFALLDLISFEYVINLSGSDYALATNDNVRRHLRPFRQLLTEDEDGYPYLVGMNFFYEVASRQALTRTVYPVFMTAAENMVGGTLMCSWRISRNIFVNLDGQIPVIRKSSQWMILHSSLVSYMRKDPRARMLLAYMEHAMIPDESFFATYILSTPLFSRETHKALQRPKRVSNFPKRLIYWYKSNQKHPQVLSWEQDRELFENDVELQRDWFFRKANIAQEHELHAWLEEQKKKHSSWSAFVPLAFYPSYASGHIKLDSLASDEVTKQNSARLQEIFKDYKRVVLNETLFLLANYLYNQINRNYEESFKPVKPF